MGAAVASGSGVAVGIWVGVGAIVAVGAGVSVGVGSEISVGRPGAGVSSGAVVAISVGCGVTTTVGSWVGFAGFVRTGWLSDGGVASVCGVAVGGTTAVGAGSEQATRISRISRAVGSRFAMSGFSPFPLSGPTFYNNTAWPRVMTPELRRSSLHVSIAVRQGPHRCWHQPPQEYWSSARNNGEGQLIGAKPPVAEAVLDAHAEELRADGMPAPPPRPARIPKDTIGDVTIGGIVFAGGGSDADCGN